MEAVLGCLDFLPSDAQHIWGTWITDDGNHSSFGASCLLKWALDETALATIALAKSIPLSFLKHAMIKQLVFIKWMSNFYLSFYTGSHVSKAGLELAIQWRITLNFWFSYLHLRIACIPQCPFFCSAGDQTLGFEMLGKDPRNWAPSPAPRFSDGAW